MKMCNMKYFAQTLAGAGIPDPLHHSAAGHAA